MNRCACGRPAVARRAVRKKSSRGARAGRPAALKDHDLCQKCWESMMDSVRAQEMSGGWKSAPSGRGYYWVRFVNRPHTTVAEYDGTTCLPVQLLGTDSLFDVGEFDRWYKLDTPPPPE